MMSKDTEINSQDKLRTVLANERTVLAYIRTAFSSFISGVALLKFFSDVQIYCYLGFIFIAGAGLVFIIGVISYLTRNKKIREW